MDEIEDDDDDLDWDDDSSDDDDDNVVRILGSDDFYRQTVGKNVFIEFYDPM